MIGGRDIYCVIAFKLKALELTGDKSTLVQHQAISWANVDPDLCRHIGSLGHNESTIQVLVRFVCVSADANF